MRSLLVLPALALASVAAFAQSPQNPATAPASKATPQAEALPPNAKFPTPTGRYATSLIVLPGVSGSCPVSLQALKTPQGAVMEQTGRSAPSHGAALNIVLRALDSKSIRQADVLVTGIVGAHVMPAADRSPETSEYFTLTGGSVPKAQLESVVYTKRLTGISTVELIDITWTDGTSWHAKPGSACRITPSPYLAVNATK